LKASPGPRWDFQRVHSKLSHRIRRGQLANRKTPKVFNMNNPEQAQRSSGLLTTSN
jgi:hypothetical protein